jgi:hypothetical protein
MSKQKYPPGWNEARVQRVIDHYENISEDELLAEDEAARKAGKSHLATPAAVHEDNGTVIAKGARRQKKRKPLKAHRRSKPHKATRSRAKSASKS